MYSRVIGKSILGFLALLSSLSLATGLAVSAPDPSLICVQNQAQHLKINTGVVDGYIGRKTRAASLELTNKYPTLKDLRPLTRDNAIVWCREIGVVDDDQVQYWPIKTEPKFKFLFSSFLNSSQQLEIQNAITFAFRYFNNYDVRLAGTIKVIASPNEAELAEKLAINSRYPMRASTARRIVRDQCRGREISGFNTAGIIVLCIGTEFNWYDSYFSLRELITHEISHEIQRQYSGYMLRDKINDKRAILQRRGPRWLTEASAIAIQFNALMPYVDTSEIIEQLRLSEKEFSGQKLSRLLYIQSTYEDYFTNYAALAGQMLANRKEGHAGYFTYWKLLARMDWQEAFTKAFGLTPDAFYDEFDKVSSKITSQSSLLPN